MSLEARLALHVRTGREKAGREERWRRKELVRGGGGRRTTRGTWERARFLKGRRRDGGTDGRTEGGTEDEDEKNGRSQHGPRAHPRKQEGLEDHGTCLPASQPARVPSVLLFVLGLTGKNTLPVSILSISLPSQAPSLPLPKDGRTEEWRRRSEETCDNAKLSECDPLSLSLSLSRPLSAVTPPLCFVSLFLHRKERGKEMVISFRSKIYNCPSSSRVRRGTSRRRGTSLLSIGLSRCGTPTFPPRLSRPNVGSFGGQVKCI